MKMVSMKMAPKKGDKGDEVKCCGMDQEEKYPWGLRINLGDEELKKLGIKELPKVGQELPFTATVKVVGVRSNESQDGENRNVELQITECALEMGKEGMDLEKKATSLYGGGDKGGA